MQQLAGVLNKGQLNALLTKVEGSGKQLATGNDIAAMNNLLAFVNQVGASIGTGVLSVTEGQPLIDTANAVVSQFLNG